VKGGLEVVPCVFFSGYECLEPDVGFAPIFEVFSECINALGIGSIVFEFGAFELL